jgi:glycosyltransferase involved in cell wall biosynthesis
LQVSQVGNTQISSELSEIYYRRFTIIIPAYNEEKRIKPVLMDIVKFVSENSLPWDVIVSIDGNDGTTDIVEALSETYPFVSYTKSSGRGGKGAAIIRASSFAGGDFVILMDADNSMEFSEVVNKIPLIQDYVAVILSRYHDGGDIPLMRRFLSRGFNILVRTFTGLRIEDTQSGYKIFRRDDFLSALRKVGATNTFYDISLLYHIHSSGGQIMETEAHYTHDDGSKFHPIGEVIGQGTSLLAFAIRHSRFYRLVPSWMISLYMRKFRWI